MTEAAHPTWRLPPTPALLVALLLIACAEIGGAPRGRFKLALARWARGTMLARPEIHGLVGVRDVDEQIMDEALTRFDGGLRLFHMHAEGMGTIVILTTMVAATWAPTPGWRRTLVALLTVGGAGYPLGYLVWAGLIPLRGAEDRERLAGWLGWMPLGGTTIVEVPRRLYDAGALRKELRARAGRLPRGLDDDVRAALQRADAPEAERGLMVFVVALARDLALEADRQLAAARADARAAIGRKFLE